MGLRGKQGFIWVIVWVLFTGGWVAATCHGPEREGPPPAPTGAVPETLIPLKVGGKEMLAEVAISEDERSLGLMHRKSLGRDRGMVFVYPEEEKLSFWMKNTLIPLSIAFCREDGRITEIQKMEPMDEMSHVSREPGMYALEVNQGWFEENGIRVGDRVEGLPPPTNREGGD